MAKLTKKQRSEAAKKAAKTRAEKAAQGGEDQGVAERAAGRVEGPKPQKASRIRPELDQQGNTQRSEPQPGKGFRRPAQRVASVLHPERVGADRSIREQSATEQSQFAKKSRVK